MEKEARRAKALQRKAEGNGEAGQKTLFDGDARKYRSDDKGKTGTLVDIEEVIEQNDRAEEEKRRLESEKIWEENEGLLSGGMV
jgi:hypothetical protein